jgi:hypothetical protein
MLMHVRAPEQMLYNILLLVTVLVFRSRMNLVVFSVSLVMQWLQLARA